MNLIKFMDTHWKMIFIVNMLNNKVSVSYTLELFQIFCTVKSKKRRSESKI